MSVEQLGFTHVFEPGDPDAGPVADVTLLLLHGTGGDETDLLPLGRMLLPGAGLLSPRGQVLEAGMPRFFRRLAEGVFDVEDLLSRTSDLAAFIERATETYRLDASRLVAVGFSNGANIAGSVLLRYPGLLMRAVLLGAMVPFEPSPDPDLSGTRILLGAGRADTLVSPVQTERLAQILRRCGAEVTVHWSPGGHEIRADTVAAARTWLNEGL